MVAVSCSLTLFVRVCVGQVLLSICSLLTDPNPEDPLVPEIAQVRVCVDGPCEKTVLSPPSSLRTCADFEEQHRAARRHGPGVDGQVRHVMPTVATSDAAVPALPLQRLCV